MAHSKIDIAGLVRSVKAKGFTVPGAAKEIADNSFDAEAVMLRIRAVTASKMVYFSDNGKGMTQEEADQCYTFHSDKPASAKSGMYGVGKPVSEGVLSDLKCETFTLTRAAGGQICQIVTDYAQCILDKTWNPVAVPMTEEYRHHWEREALESANGTVVGIRMPDDKFAEFVANIRKIAEDLKFTNQFKTDCYIHVYVDDVPVRVLVARPLDYERTAMDHRREVRIEAYRKGGEVRLYHDEAGKPGMYRFDYTTKNPETAKRIPQNAPAERLQEWEKIADMVLRSTCNPEWYPEDEAFIPGYQAISRENRILSSFDNETPTTGDFIHRKARASARHVLFASHEADSLIRPEGNKSNVTIDNIEPMLRKELKHLTHMYMTEYCKVHHPKAPRPVRVGPNTHTVDEFKAFYEDEEWRREYEALAARKRQM
jgi:hypothetical protein